MLQTIILDFGGIIIDLDQTKCFHLLRELFQVSESDPIPQDVEAILNQYEVGAFSEASFIHRLQRLRPYPITERKIQDVWNSMLVGIPQQRLYWLKEVRKEYNVFLLSNTNHTHIEWVKRHLRRAYNIVDFEETYFDHVIYSHEIHLSKPGVDIYNYVAREYSLNLEETLFIDDTLANVEGAKTAGWQAIRHDSQTEIIEYLPQYISSL